MKNCWDPQRDKSAHERVTRTKIGERLSFTNYPLTRRYNTYIPSWHRNRPFRLLVSINLDIVGFQYGLRCHNKDFQLIFMELYILLTILAKQLKVDDCPERFVVSVVTTDRNSFVVMKVCGEHCHTTKWKRNPWNTIIQIARPWTIELQADAWHWRFCRCTRWWHQQKRHYPYFGSPHISIIVLSKNYPKYSHSEPIYILMKWVYLDTNFRLIKLALYLSISRQQKVIIKLLKWSNYLQDYDECRHLRTHETGPLSTSKHSI